MGSRGGVDHEAEMSTPRRGAAASRSIAQPRVSLDNRPRRPPLRAPSGRRRNVRCCYVLGGGGCGYGGGWLNGRVAVLQTGASGDAGVRCGGNAVCAELRKCVSVECGVASTVTAARATAPPPAGDGLRPARLPTSSAAVANPPTCPHARAVDSNFSLESTWSDR